MNLSIIYLPNETGDKLSNLCTEEWEQVVCSKICIEGVEYREISIGDKSSKHRKIVNTPRAIKNCIAPEVLKGILSLNGIAFDNTDNENINRTYNILVCDFSVLSIRLQNHTKTKNQIKYIRESENTKVADIAKRTVHLLGLDIAMVCIVLTARRRYKVISVDSSPIVKDKDLMAIMSKIKNMYEIETYLTREVKMGADPEFMLFNTRNGRMISASEFFPRDGVVGCDNIRIPNRQQRPIAEVRPAPDNSPLEVVSAIRQALANANKLAPYRNVKWVAGSHPLNGYSIGGHIHFSNTRLNAGILRALDNYVGIPVFLIEDPSSAVKRRKKYGFLADYREKDHGGFEYRTPGSWLVSQKIATAVLCLAKIVASRYAYLPKNYLNTVEAQTAFYSGDQEYFRKYFFKIWNGIENTDMYRIYKDELQIIPEMITNGICWDEKADFRKAWKITMSSKNFSTRGSSQNTNSVSTSAPNVRVNTPRASTTNSAGNNRTNSSRSSSGTRTTVRTRGSTAIINSGSNRNINNYRRTNISSGRIISSGNVRRSR